MHRSDVGPPDQGLVVKLTIVRHKYQHGAVCYKECLRRKCSITSHTHTHVYVCVETLNDASKEVVLEVNVDKTECRPKLGYNNRKQLI
jgi:hypothetical protein